MELKTSNKQIKAYLKANIDLKYQLFLQKLIPNCANILGVRMSILKALAKSIAKGDYQDFLTKKDFSSHEETMLYGLVLGNLKIPFAELVEYIAAYVPYLDNWAVCDSFCSSLKITNQNKDTMLVLIENYLSSTKEFEVRFAMIMLMSYYLDAKHLDLVLNLYNNNKHEGYYVKMAIAWGISVAFIKFREQTVVLLNNNRLSAWTNNKAIQKIIESNRVSRADKEMVRQWKRAKDKTN
ncbi:MAG: DNA alkylation repair protein [Clostridia bacterium]